MVLGGFGWFHVLSITESQQTDNVIAVGALIMQSHAHLKIRNFCHNQGHTARKCRNKAKQPGRAPVPTNKLDDSGEVKAVTFCSTHKIDQQETDG